MKEFIGAVNSFFDPSTDNIAKSILAVGAALIVALISQYVKNKLDKGMNSPKNMGISLSGDDLQGIRN